MLQRLQPFALHGKARDVVMRKPDAFQRHASREDLLAEAGIDAAGIRAAVLRRWPQLATTESDLPRAAGAL